MLVVKAHQHITCERDTEIQLIKISAPMLQFVNMHLNIFFILWMLQFPAQASASWYCTPAYYLWRETLIHLSNIHCSVCTIYKMHLKILVRVMDVAIPMQAIASCRSTPAHNLWRDTHIQFHLQQFSANFKQTWHKSSLDRGESILCKWRANPFPRGENNKNVKFYWKN